MVDKLVKIFKESKISILDIGTGSGCIPLALKNNMLESHVSGCDISEKAIEIAMKNAKDLNIDVDFFSLDILNDTKWSGRKLDVIVSNPPYIPIKEKLKMSSNVLDYEPSLALFVPNNNPLLFYINNKKPTYLIVNLLTLLPIILSPLLSRHTRIILRILICIFRV